MIINDDVELTLEGKFYIPDYSGTYTNFPDPDLYNPDVINPRSAAITLGERATFKITDSQSLIHFDNIVNDGCGIYLFGNDSKLITENAKIVINDINDGSFGIANHILSNLDLISNYTSQFNWVYCCFFNC